MAYFESPKNRAMWNRELDQLRQLRQERSNASPEELAALRGKADNMQAENNPLRERVSYEQLLGEERAAQAEKQSNRVKAAPTAQAERKAQEPKKSKGEPTL